ncbi:MRP49 [Candida pseudojiufengensis]|uniref:MRP49 n=1 Tax=Candida pseudojiufengensis TaxID=497109 RepID=UPI0022257E0E|nr:MRP49 [Candida pseudojiufengensis]KAI5960744.1 MRP49 [Candida pseudojiufengensis]
MSMQMIITPKQKYNPNVLKQIKKVNRLRGEPKNSYKFDPTKYKEIELFIYHQRPILYKPANGIRYFWKESLPTLRYHNPEIQFTVNNITIEQEEDLSKLPLKLKIHGINSKDDSLIECASKPPHKIFSELINLTNARQMTVDEIPKIELKPASHFMMIKKARREQREKEEQERLAKESQINE